MALAQKINHGVEIVTIFRTETTNNQEQPRTKYKIFIGLACLRWAIYMLERTEGIEDILKVLDLEKDDKFSRIRCPACKWRPEASSRWICLDPSNEHPTGGCWTEWNTFDTRGVCPGCGHRWIKTTCLRCGVHSLHEDWYEDRE